MGAHAAKRGWPAAATRILAAAAILVVSCSGMARATLSYASISNGTVVTPLVTVTENINFLMNRTEPYNLTGPVVMPVWRPLNESFCTVATFLPAIPLLLANATSVPPIVIHVAAAPALLAGCLLQQYTMRAIDEALYNMWKLPVVGLNGTPIALPPPSAGAVITPQSHPHPYTEQQAVVVCVSLMKTGQNMQYGGPYGENYGTNYRARFPAQLNQLLWMLIKLEDSVRVAEALGLLPGSNTARPTGLIVATAVSQTNPWTEALLSTWHVGYSIAFTVLFALTVVYAAIELTLVLRAKWAFDLRVFLYATSIFFLSTTAVLFYYPFLPWQVYNLLFWLTYPLGAVAYSTLLVKWASVVRKIQPLDAQVFHQPEAPVPGSPSAQTAPVTPSAPRETPHDGLLAQKWRQCANVLRRTGRRAGRWICGALGAVKRLLVRALHSHLVYTALAYVVPLVFTATSIVMLVAIFLGGAESSSVAVIKQQINLLTVGIDMLLYVWPVLCGLQAALFLYFGSRMLINLKVIKNANKRHVIRNITLMTFVSSFGWLGALIAPVLLATQVVGRTLAGYFVIELLKMINVWILFGSIVLTLGIRAKRPASGAKSAGMKANGPAMQSLQTPSPAPPAGGLGLRRARVAPALQISTQALPRDGHRAGVATPTTATTPVNCEEPVLTPLPTPWISMVARRLQNTFGPSARADSSLPSAGPHSAGPQSAAPLACEQTLVAAASPLDGNASHRPQQSLQARRTSADPDAITATPRVSGEQSAFVFPPPAAARRNSDSDSILSYNAQLKRQRGPSSAAPSALKSAVPSSGKSPMTHSPSQSRAGGSSGATTAVGSRVSTPLPESAASLAAFANAIEPETIEIESGADAPNSNRALAALPFSSLSQSVDQGALGPSRAPRDVEAQGDEADDDANFLW